MKHMPLVIAGSVILLVATGMFSATLFAERVDLFQSAGGFDRWDCEVECRRAYGGYEWAPPRLGEAGYYGYARCIQNCERKFWKAFDKESEELWKQDPSP